MASCFALLCFGCFLSLCLMEPKEKKNLQEERKKFQIFFILFVIALFHKNRNLTKKLFLYPSTIESSFYLLTQALVTLSTSY